MNNQPNLDFIGMNVPSHTRLDIPKAPKRDIEISPPQSGTRFRPIPPHSTA